MVQFNQKHIEEMLNSNKVFSINETSSMSSVKMFSAFVEKNMEMKKEFVIVTYQGMIDFPNIHRASWKGTEGVHCFHFKNSDDMLDKMNELAKTIQA